VTYRLLLIELIALLMSIALYVAFAVGITAASAPACDNERPESASPLQTRPGAPPGSGVAQSAEHRPPPEVAGAEPAVGSGGVPSRAVSSVRPPAAVSQRPREIQASWYCNADAGRGPLSRCTRGYPDGPGPDLYAAASPDLPRGTLRVCAERCVTVEAIDCRCSSPGIDLYADAFAELGVLSRGVLSVTVRVPLAAVVRCGAPLAQSDGLCFRRLNHAGSHRSEQSMVNRR